MVGKFQWLNYRVIGIVGVTPADVICETGVVSPLMGALGTSVIEDFVGCWQRRV